MLAKTCNFGTLRDSLIRDRIVCGSNNTSMRERLLRERKLTLDSCIQLCRAAELSRENVKTISGVKVEEVHAVQGPSHHRQPENIIDCRFCGKSHERNKQKCPAYGKKCKKCGKDNHFATKCKTSQQTAEKKRRQVHNVAECESDSEFEEILCVTAVEKENVNAVDTHKWHNKQLFAVMLLGRNTVKFPNRLWCYV